MKFDDNFDLFKFKEEYGHARDHGIGSEIRDGFHSMSELYHHRMIMFSIILKIAQQKGFKAWRSLKHADGSMFPGFFIVGVSTPYGDFAYHYHERFLHHFDGVEEVEFAPEWDGHGPSDIWRLYSILE